MSLSAATQLAWQGVPYLCCSVADMASHSLGLCIVCLPLCAEVWCCACSGEAAGVSAALGGVHPQEVCGGARRLCGLCCLHQCPGNSCPRPQQGQQAHLHLSALLLFIRARLGGGQCCHHSVCVQRVQMELSIISMSPGDAVSCVPYSSQSAVSGDLQLCRPSAGPHHALPLLPGSCGAPEAPPQLRSRPCWGAPPGATPLSPILRAVLTAVWAAAPG